MAVDPELVEYVARAMVNADLPQFGACWPWPDDLDTSETARQTRQDAREVAEVAIHAVMSYGR